MAGWREGLVTMLPIHENKVLRRYEAFELQIHQ
jgi:hypothetical protein